jgi:hypothetical protein
VRDISLSRDNSLSPTKGKGPFSATSSPTIIGQRERPTRSNLTDSDEKDAQSDSALSQHRSNPHDLPHLRGTTLIRSGLGQSRPISSNLPPQRLPAAGPDISLTSDAAPAAARMRCQQQSNSNSSSSNNNTTTTTTTTTSWSRPTHHGRSS